MNIYVSNLSFHITDEDLTAMFASYGAVQSAKVVCDRATGRSRGFAFVEMPDAAAAAEAIAGLDNGTIDGRPIRVVEAKPKEEVRTFNPFRNNRGYQKKKW